MKKIILILLISLISAFSINAQTNDTAEQKKALSEIGSLNGQIITLYKQKNYDEALKLALNLWDTAEKNGLSKDLRVLPSLANLAEIYFKKNKFTDAAATYQKILEAYQSNSGNMTLPIAKTEERIALIYYNKKDYDKAEDFFLKALSLREKLNAESKDTAYINNALGDVYRVKKNYEKAQEFYLKAIKINDKVLSKTEKENREDISNYECFLYHKALQEDKINDVSKQIRDFYYSRNVPMPGDNSINSGIVNGKALNLVKPPYPRGVGGASGFVLVRVTIDEQGNVISAKATCGILEFVQAVEEAARRSKFTPTLLSGQPVKVTGLIVYNFVGR